MPLHQEPGQKPSQPGKGWPGLPGKCGLVKPAKHGHSQAFLATLAAKAWPSWHCYFRGWAFSATLVIKARPNPGVNYSSQAWPGFFEFPGQKFITLRDCNMNTSESLPFVVPWRTLFTLQLLFFTKNDTLSVSRNFLTSGNGCFQSPSFPNHVTIYVCCFSFSVFGPGQLLPGQAGLALWPWHSGFFFIAWPTWPKPGHKPGSPQLSGQAFTPVWPGSWCKGDRSRSSCF